MTAKLAELAAQGIYIGTSSWKYAGWRGTLYDEGRYVYRGKIAESRFERECLREYAEVFKTVCVDAAYYKFPDRRYLEGMVSQVPADFRFGFKVTDEITIKKFTNLPRHGIRAGRLNENFLNADLFATAFLKPCEEFREQVGLLMFEFSQFHKSDFGRGRDFVEALDGFLAKLPRGWPYGVEMRNRNFLHPDYFAMLSRHGVAHIFNSWTHMPGVGEQLDMPGSITHPPICGARFLLKPGRDYEAAVKLFSPYREVKEVDREARRAARQLIDYRIKGTGKHQTYIFVNNRLEGNALATIQAVAMGREAEVE